MEILVYVFLGLAILAVLILLIIAVKISTLVKKINRNLEILPGLIAELKTSAEKLNENFDLSKNTFNNLNHILSELKILPKIVEELSMSIKDFEAFLKGQIEVVKDDLHFTLEESREILKDVKTITSEVKGKTLQVAHDLEPLVGSLSETFDLGRQILDDFNRSLKKIYIETSAVITGISELLSGIKRVLRIK
ncbi:MAG: hypothetical protein N2327_06310 [Caldimicrobium sp.]|nr:hypothetical protein [Caldimicrobium sp.]MCX7874025.1 hypothetical protein [Caldimicrobium sp.]MDW8093849.1 hypothetical protein [Caldimicrobium sp.]